MASPDLKFPIPQIAQCINAQCQGADDITITGLNTLEEAKIGDLTFIGSQKHAKLWPASNASAAIVTQGIEVPDHNPQERTLLVVENADLAMAEILALFTPKKEPPTPGTSPQAAIDPTAVIDPTATIAPFASIGPRAVIGKQVIIESGVHISADCVIGENCVIRAGVAIRERCQIGARVSIHPNAVIGADGFGYRPDGQGGLTKIPHLGTVIIGDDVEIGANTCIDRGKFGDTIIGPHTKFDNLVQIGHNVKIGRGCVFAGHAGIAGSAVIGDFCQFGGKTGVADHTNVGSYSSLAAHSAIMRDIPEGKSWAGLPAMDAKEFWRILRVWSKLPELHKNLKQLQRSVKDLEAVSDRSSDQQHAKID